jgi:hypothetical protein
MRHCGLNRLDCLLLRMYFDLAKGLVIFWMHPLPTFVEALKWCTNFFVLRN